VSIKRAMLAMSLSFIMGIYSRVLSAGDNRRGVARVESAWSESNRPRTITPMGKLGSRITSKHAGNIGRRFELLGKTGQSDLT
jgi:hypothetical protein